MFKVGDKVRVLDGSSNESYYDGWSQGMYEYVGKICIVRSISGRGVRLEGNIFTWDARYLELVEEKKMENKITIDGKEYELSAELVEKIKAEVMEQEKMKNPFERNVDERYYYVDACGGVGTFIDIMDGVDNVHYSTGNYCTDKAIMKQRALHETLNRLLWRYSETHGGESRWSRTDKDVINHFYICKRMNPEEYSVGYVSEWKKEGIIYFKDEKTALAAIEEVVKPFLAAHPEFVW